MNAATRRTLLVLAVGLGMMLNPLNTSMISLAIARLQEQFALTFADVSWLISTYYLVSAVAQPILGTIADRYGRKRVFMGGLALVAVSSALAPTSPTFPALLAYRAVQALGTSALFPSGMGIVRQEATERQARYMSRLSVIMSVSAAVGPSVGGFLLRAGDWPAIFTINFPVILISFVLAWKVIPADAGARSVKDSFDFRGVFLFSLLIVLILLFLLSLRSVWGWSGLAAAAVLGVRFYRLENRLPRPFVDVRFLRRHPPVCLIYLQFILVNVVSYSIMFGFPSYLQHARHLDPQQAGLIMMAVAGSNVLAAPLAGRWIDRSGPNPALWIAAAATLLGTVLMMTIGEGTADAWTVCVLALLGFGSGFNNLGLQMSLYVWVPPAETGIASGLFMTSRFLGTIFSSTLLADFFGGEVSTAGLIRLGAVCAGIAAVLAALVLLLRRSGAKPAYEK
jgi:MFS family permease